MSLALRALFSSRTSEPSIITVALDGDVIPVQLRRNRLARRYTLRIHTATREVVLTMPLRGVDHRIVHRPAARGTVWIEAESADVRLLCVAGAAPHVSRRVRDYLKREAKRDLEAASKQAALALGVTLKRVSIRDQSSRWGSCSTTGVLSYSWRLILAPGFVLDYLAAHEAAHLVEMNHSCAFWRQVERICPEFKKAKAWLDAHGADLHRYGMS